MTVKNRPGAEFRRRGPEHGEDGCEAATVNAGAVSLSHPAYVDPIYRISKLAASTRKPLSVSTDTKLEEAVTHMLTDDFSQLPVMTSERTDLQTLREFARFLQKLQSIDVDGNLQKGAPRVEKSPC